MNKTKSLTAWEAWLFGLKKRLGLIYDPDDYPDAPKPDFVPMTAKQGNKKQEVIADDVTYNARTGQYQRIVRAESDDTLTDKATDKNTTKATDKTKIVGQKTPTNNRQATDKDKNVVNLSVTPPPIVADKPPTTMSWEILGTPTNTQDLNRLRTRTLTDADRQLLTERGMDEAKAQIIKEYWFKKVPRNVAAKMLGAGYSVSIIGNYYALFNTIIKETESPTPQEK